MNENAIPRAVNRPICSKTGKSQKQSAPKAPIVVRAASNPTAHISLEASLPEVL